MQQSGFNPKARWDRHIPESSQEPITELLNEPIAVLALFKAGKIYPQKFAWHNKEYAINRITYNWQERRGQEIFNYFSVTSGEDLYQISFNNTSFGWRLDKIIE